MKGFITQAEQQKSQNLQKEEGNMSVMEKYPEYGFIPTSLNDKRGTLQKIILFFATLVFAYFGLGFTIGGIIESCEGDPALGFVMIIGGVSILTIYYLLIISKWYINTFPKSHIADYIQSTKGKTICVKDGRFGVLNNFNNHLIIPTIYDKLSWTQKDKLLRAELKGEVFLIDIHNNRLK